MNYVILQSSDATDLEKRVTAALDQGWKPQGGVAVAQGDYGRVYAQAMIREEG